MSSAEHVVSIGKLARQIETASAKGFRTKPAMELLYSLEAALDDLLVAATREYLASEVGA